MSIKPIDLQTLFSQINHVGKDQAAQKDALLMQQTVAGSELAEETHRQDESVNEAKAASDGPDSVKEEGHEKSQKRQSKGKSKEQPKEEKKYYRDPNLGTHVDIEG